MREIIIKVGSPQEAENLVLMLFKNGYTPKSAIIRYNIRAGLPGKFRRMDQYPLTMHGKLNGVETRLLVSPLAAGCRRAESYSLAKILKAAQFHFELDDIFTIRRINPDTGIVSLKYSR